MQPLYVSDRTSRVESTNEVSACRLLLQKNFFSESKTLHFPYVFVFVPFVAIIFMFLFYSVALVSLFC